MTTPDTTPPETTVFGDAECLAEEHELAIIQADHTQLFASIGLIDSAREALALNQEERLKHLTVEAVQAASPNPPEPFWPSGVVRAAVWRSSVHMGGGIGLRFQSRLRTALQLQIERYTLRLITTYVKEDGEEAPHFQNVDVASSYAGMAYPYPGFTLAESKLVVDKGLELMEAGRTGPVPHLSHDLMHITRPEVVKSLGRPRL